MRNRIFEAAALQVFERGWLSSNNVLFDGGDTRETVLIDSGYGTHASQTVALVRHALGRRRLDRIANTHLHSDHCGGNHALHTAFGCSIDVPSGEVEKVDRWDEALLTFRDTGQQCPRFHRSGSIQDGDAIECGGSILASHCCAGARSGVGCAVSARVRDLDFGGRPLGERIRRHISRTGRQTGLRSRA
jgi:glyoxylase-like metal-dependent hydrolase (beta-lactamase superfamily II)